MLAGLVVRRESGDSPSYDTQMRRLRQSVDEVDEEVLELLGRRMEVVRAMGELKRPLQVSTLQPTRWQEVLASRTAAAQGKGLSGEFVAQLYQLIHEEAIRVQEEPLFGRRKGDRKHP